MAYKYTVSVSDRDPTKVPAEQCNINTYLFSSRGRCRRFMDECLGQGLYVTVDLSFVEELPPPPEEDKKAPFPWAC